jgi:predicted transposase YbfD/YdcC
MAPVVPLSPGRPSSAPSPLSIQRHFCTLKDPRRRHLRRHLLLDIVVIAICAVICGADDWQQVVTFATNRRDWLKRFLRLPNGIPSHDTFERVFDRLDPLAFGACFRAWIAAACAAMGIKQVALDGKTLRHSGRTGKLGPLHVVSAWAGANHLALGQVAVADKSNEITAIPRLLALLDLQGCLVTIDAMGCQKEIAKQITEAGGDYLLTVKDNQPHLLEDIRDRMEKGMDSNFAGMDADVYESRESGHGRKEYRRYTILRDTAGVRDPEAWAGLKVLGMCYSERVVGGKQSEEVRYFIGSRLASAKEYGQAYRGHWGVENGLHWHLDITFGEDASRIQKRWGAENFAQMRRLALSLLKQHPAKSSVACKRLAAALNTDILEEILRGHDNSGNQ